MQSRVTFLCISVCQGMQEMLKKHEGGGFAQLTHLGVAGDI